MRSLVGVCTHGLPSCASDAASHPSKAEPDSPPVGGCRLAVRDPPSGTCHDEEVTVESDPMLVPELLVVDLARSIEFWCVLCGFSIRYSRPDEGFAYITLGSAHVMLEQVGVGRNWVTGPLDAPLGRGINFQISVPNALAVAGALGAAGVSLFMEPERKWYRIGDHETGVQQFLVTDPDGYLVRFQSSLGTRPAGR